MSIWEALTGKKTHCVVCGKVIPPELLDSVPTDREGHLYCSLDCQMTIVRLSTIPPPPPEK